MHTSRSQGRRTSRAYLIVALLLLLGSIGVVVTTVNDIDLDTMTASSGLTPEETAYYEYVAPRLDRLVMEMDDVVVMVEGKSRDILALTLSGGRIEALTDEITAFGVENGVPPRYEEVHTIILDATGTATATFGQAREALRSFDFSRMNGLVDGFTTAATQLRAAHETLIELGGIEGA